MQLVIPQHCVNMTVSTPENQQDQFMLMPQNNIEYIYIKVKEAL